MVSGESVAVQHAARESVIAGTLADHTRLDPGLVRRADRCKLQGFAWGVAPGNSYSRPHPRQAGRRGSRFIRNEVLRQRLAALGGFVVDVLGCSHG